MRADIENLYYQLEHLIDDYIESKDATEARDILNNYLEEQTGKGVTNEFNQNIEQWVSDICVEYEKQGFVYGFEYAVRLLTSGTKRELLRCDVAQHQNLGKEDFRVGERK